MIDNLTGSIRHYKQKARTLREFTKSCAEAKVGVSTKKYIEHCLERAEHNEQLAAWLEELQERREAVKKLEKAEEYYKDSLFGDGIRFALKVISEPRKRDWESEVENGRSSNQDT